MTCAYCKISKSECKPDCQYAPYCPPDKEKDLELISTTYGTLSIKLMIDNNDTPDLKVEALRTLTLEAKARELDKSKSLSAEVQRMKIEWNTALKRHYEACNRIHELEKVPHAERERAVKIIEEVEKLKQKLTWKRQVLKESIQNFSGNTEEDVFMIPKPESDNYVPQPEATLIKHPHNLAGAKENH